MVILWKVISALTFRVCLDLICSALPLGFICCLWGFPLPEVCSELVQAIAG